jgi:hypothetical protein
LSYGYYEAKDPKFENSITAVLYQNNLEVMRIDMTDDRQLEQILLSFIDFERQEIFQFHKAIDQFKNDLPNLVIWCRDEIDNAKTNSEFNKRTSIFF